MKQNQGINSTAIVEAYERAELAMDDPSEAFEKAKQLLESDLDDRQRISKHNRGMKRHPGYNKILVKPLDGVGYELGTKIRAVVALRYAGYPDTKIEKALGLYNKFIWKHETGHPEAFVQAKEDLVKNALDEYHQNVAFSRAAVSKMGLAAVETLAELMDDKNASGAVRLKAADTVLKLSFGGPGKESDIVAQAVGSMGGAIAEILEATKDRGGYIISRGEVVDGEADSLGTEL